MKVFFLFICFFALQADAQQIAKANNVQIVVTAGTIVNASGGITFTGTTNFRNDGTVNFIPATMKQNWLDSTAAGVLDNASTGLVHFNGDSIHTFFGNSKFYNLRINSDSFINMQSNMEIKNQLSLDKGLIYTNAYTVLVSNPSLTAIQSTGNFAGSWINGKLSRVENTTGTDYFFPIGKMISQDSFYAPIRVEKFNNSTATHTAVYFRSSPFDRNNYLNPPIDHISDIEYWEIQSSDFAGSTDDDAKISLSWRGGSAVSITPATRDSLLVAQYTSTPQWEATGDIVGTLSIVAGSNNFGFVKQRFFVGNFTNAEKLFTLASRSPFNILPYQLLNWMATTDQNKVRLQWDISFEQEVKYYVIEKSLLGNNFSVLQTILSAKLNSNSYLSYDLNPQPGWNYYHLKIVDALGNIRSGGIRKVWFGKGLQQIHFYPNPVQQILQLNIPAGNNPSIIQIFDFKGQLISTYRVNSIRLQIPVQHLKSGGYTLKWINGKEMQTYTFIKD